MKLVAIMPVRNESWVLGLSARAALMWCDELVILDHASTDATPRIITDLFIEYPGRVFRFAEADPVWTEMAHRQLLLDMARASGGTHVAIVDADEVLTGNLLPSIRAWVERVPMGEILQVPWVCLRGGIDRYHSHGVWSQQDVSLAFRDEPRCPWTARNGYDFHQRAPMGRPEIAHRPIRGVSKGGLMHLQFVNSNRLRWKQLLYCLTERLRWPDRKKPVELAKEYGLAVYGAGDLRTAETPKEWWEPYAGLMQYIQVDAPAWQETECRRIIAERPELLSGLDTFGVQL